jgi:hypothetical protein
LIGELYKKINEKSIDRRENLLKAIKKMFCRLVMLINGLIKGFFARGINCG